MTPPFYAIGHLFDNNRRSSIVLCMLSENDKGIPEEPPEPKLQSTAVEEVKKKIRTMFYSNKVLAAVMAIITVMPIWGFIELKMERHDLKKERQELMASDRTDREVKKAIIIYNQKVATSNRYMKLYAPILADDGRNAPLQPLDE